MFFVCLRVFMCSVFRKRAKINVTCLLKVLSKNGSRGQKYTRERLFGGLSSGCALSICIAFVSLFLSLVVVVSTMY